MAPTKSIGSFIAALRKANGLTQKQLAEKLNVSDKAVSRWERDEALPDLSLIPVIAEIFGVTTDEILRGERIDPTAQAPERAAEKTEKQLRRLLKDALTKYRTRSILSICLALLGLVAAMIGNIAFLRAYVGFMAGCVFLIASAACQVVFLILGFAALDNEEFDADMVSQCKKSMICIAELVFGLILVLLAACLPLITQVDDAYWGLTGYFWVSYGRTSVLIAAVLCLAGSAAVNLKLGYWHLPDMSKPMNRLRRRCAVILLIAFAVTGIGQLIFVGWLSNNWEVLGVGTRFDNWDDFKTYMETPTDSSLSYDWNTIEVLPDGFANTSAPGEDEESRPIEQVTGRDGTVYCQYVHRNQAVCMIQYGSEADGFLPVYTYTSAQYNEASHRFTMVNTAWIVLYLLEAVIVGIYYRKKKNAIADEG